ncbi:MAG: HAD-IIB family hydrolase [Nitrospiraceae bacterium]|nr:HAD-IIB family hydrolase [Nitrospiraceae bacterium]
MTNWVIFTDLDGTLLDYSAYSFDRALPALDLIRQRGYPLVLCSSKTKREIEHYREKLANSHPFISENGGGIFIPMDYFDFAPDIPDYAVCAEDDYIVIRMGAGYATLRKTIVLLREKGFRVRGFGDMTGREISEVSGMTIEEAVMAKERHFDEPFFFEGTEEEKACLFDTIRGLGLYCTQGRFLHLLGDNNKGKAVAVLSDLYRKQYGTITTMALGDSPNDIPMLRRVDFPVIVRKPDGSYHPHFSDAGTIKAPGPGPEGWNSAVLELLGKGDPADPS